MSKLLVSLSLVLCVSCSYAKTRGYGEFGIAVGHPYTTAWDKIKTVEFGLVKDIENNLTVRTNVGGWSDRCEMRSRVKDSLYTTAQIGVYTKTVGVYAEYFIGPAMLSHIDYLLGSHFQIAQEIGFGLRDERGVKVGIALKHFSNAGLIQPNLGRNFIVIKVEL